MVASVEVGKMVDYPVNPKSREYSVGIVKAISKMRTHVIVRNLDTGYSVFTKIEKLKY